MSNFIKTALAKVRPHGPNITNLKEAVSDLDDRLDALEAVLRPAAPKPVPYPAFPAPVNDPDNIDGFTRKDVGELIAAILRSGQDLGRRRRAVESIYEEFKAVIGARLVSISDPHSLGAFSEEVGDAAYWASEAVKAREKVKSLEADEAVAMGVSSKYQLAKERLYEVRHDLRAAQSVIAGLEKRLAEEKRKVERAAVSESLLEAANGRVSDLEEAVQRQRKENEWLRKELAEARKVVVVKLPGGAAAYIDPPTARATRR